MKHTTNVVSDLIPPSQETTLANQSTLDHHQVPVAAAFRMNATRTHSQGIAKAAATAALVGVLSWGISASVPQTSWANGYNLADGSFRYANRDSSTKAQKYTDIALVPCDKNHQSDKDKADRTTFGHYYKVTYTFNNNFEYWGGRPFWWCTIPQGTEIQGNITKQDFDSGDKLTKSEELDINDWAQHNRFLWKNEGSDAAKFKEEWARMTGENFGYNQAGGTIDTSRKFSAETKNLLVNWTPAGNVKRVVTFYLKVNDMTKPLRFAAGVYQVMGNWHYTQGKVETPSELPAYSKLYELAYPERLEVQAMGTTTEENRKQILKGLWEKNKDNADLLSKLFGEPKTEADFEKAVKINDDGSASVTYKDSTADHPSTDTIAKESLTKRYVPLNERIAPKYPKLTLVKKPQQLSSDEQKAVKEAVLKANEDIKDQIQDVSVDAKGNATVTYKDKYQPNSTSRIDAANLVLAKPSLAESVHPYYPVAMPVGNPSDLSKDEMDTLRKQIFDANKANKEFMDAIENKEDKIVVNKDGSATVTYKDDEGNEYPSKTTMAANRLVYKRPKIADDVTLEVKTPARIEVKDRTKLESDEQAKVRDALWTANQGIQDKLKDTKETAFTFDNAKQEVMVTFKDGSTRTLMYDELVYTKGKAAEVTTKLRQKQGDTGKTIKYHLTPQVVQDGTVDNPKDSDWMRFIRQFIRDNFTKTNGSPLTENDVKDAANCVYAPWSIANKKNEWKPKADTSGLELISNDWRVSPLTIISKNNDEMDFSDGTSNIFALKKSECFVSNAPAFDKDKKKADLDKILDKILDNKGLSEEDKQKVKDKFKKDHEQDINNMDSEDKLGKLIGDAQKEADAKKKEAEVQKQKDAATQGLTGEDKKKLEDELNGQTDPDKIREIVNKHNNKKADEEQKQKNEQKQQEQQAKQAESDTKHQQEQQAIETKKQQQQTQDNADKQKGEEAQKKAELDKKKQAAIDEINHNGDLTPEDKETYRKQVEQAGDIAAVETAQSAAKQKGEANKTAAQTNNNKDMSTEKTSAKDEIGKLQNLSDTQKGEFKNQIEGADSSDKIAEILENARKEDDKAGAKKKIEALKKAGALTEDEAQDFNKRIDDAKTSREIDAIVEEAELLKVKKDARDKLAKLEHLNNAQKQAAQDAVDGAQTDPSNDKMKTIEQVKAAITKTVENATNLDKKMEKLKNLVDLVNKQKDELTKKPEYTANTDNKKTNFDTALAAAEKAIDKDKGENSDATAVDEMQGKLEAAVEALGGDVVDRSQLKAEVDKALALTGKAPNTQASYTYTNASADKKATFDTKLKEAEDALADKNASQEALTQAAQNLANASAALDGADKSALVAKIAAAVAAKETPAYTADTHEKQTALDNALAMAQQINNKAGAKAQEITDAIDKLDAALAALSGKVWADKIDPAGPSPKIKVDRADKLTPQEQTQIKEAVEKANAQHKDKIHAINVDEKGQVTITYKDDTAKYPSKDVIAPALTIEVKTPENTTLKLPTKIRVPNAKKLTADEQKKVKEGFLAANTDVKDENVAVGEDGTITVTFPGSLGPDGKPQTKVVPGTSVVEQMTQAEIHAGDVKPLVKPVLVFDVDHLTQGDIDAAKAALAQANKALGISADMVSLNAQTKKFVITFKDGSTISLDMDKVVSERTSANTEIHVPDHKLQTYNDALTAEEKAQVAAAIVAANADIRLGLDRVSVADDGAATITFKNGSTKVVAAASLVGKLKKPTGSMEPNQGGADHTKTKESKARVPETSDSFDGGALAALASSALAAVSGAFGIKRKKKARKNTK